MPTVPLVAVTRPDGTVEEHLDATYEFTPSRTWTGEDEVAYSEDGVTVHAPDGDHRYEHGEWQQVQVSTAPVADNAPPVIAMNNNETRVYTLDGVAPDGALTDWRVDHPEILDLGTVHNAAAEGFPPLWADGLDGEGHGACRIRALGPVGDCTLTITTGGTVTTVVFRVTGPASLVQLA
jgi:hypothetical protein